MPTELNDSEILDMLYPRVLSREEYYAPFHLTRDAYRNMPYSSKYWLLYCPATETAKRLDPEDPRDVQIMQNWRHK
jgi:hypothetical protein